MFTAWISSDKILVTKSAKKKRGQVPPLLTDIFFCLNMNMNRIYRKKFYCRYFCWFGPNIIYWSEEYIGYNNITKIHQIISYFGQS